VARPGHRHGGQGVWGYPAPFTIARRYSAPDWDGDGAHGEVGRPVGHVERAAGYPEPPARGARLRG